MLVYFLIPNKLNNNIDKNINHYEYLHIYHFTLHTYKNYHKYIVLIKKIKFKIKSQNL